MKQLPLPAQLNVDADKLAGDCMAAHPDKDYTVVPILPTSGVQLHLSAGTITYNMKKEVSMARTTEPMKQYMIKKYGWEEETFLDIDWEAHRRGANRHHKQRTTLNKHLGNILPVGKVVSRYDPVKYRSDCPFCSTGDGTCLETCSHVYRCPARSAWRKQFMSGLRKKLNSLGTEIGLMEMMLAGVKSALTRQQFRVPQDLRNLAAAQEAIGWTHLFKGRISKQWIDRQQDHIGNKATKKNNALNWATTVIDYFFTQWFKVWDQRNLDRHGHDYQGQANKLKDVAFREITHLYTFVEAVSDDIRWLFQTPLEECRHWPLFRQRAWISNWENVIKKEHATQMETG